MLTCEVCFEPFIKLDRDDTISLRCLKKCLSLESKKKNRLTDIGKKFLQVNEENITVFKGNF